MKKLRFCVRIGRAQKLVDCEAPSAAEWHHIAGVFDGRRLCIYVDGVLARERSVSGAIATTDNPLHIGTRIDNESKFFDGRIDDVRIYGRALSREEIAKLHSQDIARSGLAGCWRFDAKKGDTAVDSSGNDCHGKIVGGERVKGHLGGALSFRVRDATWKPHKVPTDKRSPAVRLGSLLRSSGSRSIGFAYTRIVSPEGGPHRFYFDGERAVELYVNGALAGSCETRNVPLIPDRVAAKVDLAKGVNHVVLKVTRERGDWRFVFRHESDAATGRVALLRQLVADFPEEPERSARALFEVAAIREEAGFLRKAADVLAEARDVDGAPADVVREAALGRARLLGTLRDHGAAAAELRTVIASLPAGSAERFELSLDLLRSLVRAGGEERAAGVVAELGAGGPERAARAHGVLAAAYEERGDAAKRITALGDVLRHGGKAAASDDSLLVERAEAILAPFRKDYAGDGLPDLPEVRTALGHYRDAIALLPTREHGLVAPVVGRAEAALAKGGLDVALGLFTAAYFRAWMVRDGFGEQIVSLADEAGIRMLPPGKEADGNPREFSSVLNGARAQVADADQVKDWWAVGGFDNKDWKAYGNPYVGPGKVDVTRPVRGKKWRPIGVRFPEGATDVRARRTLWPSLCRHVMPHAAVSGGKAYFGTLDETFAVDLATGGLEWRSGVPFAALRAPRTAGAFGGLPETAPIVLGALVFSRAHASAGAGRGYAIEARDSRTGELRWSTDSAEELSGLTAITPPCASDGRVFALFRGTGESQLVLAACLDSSGGDVLWRTSIVSGIAEVELAREERLSVADHAAAPAAAGGDVYFATDLGAVAAVDATTGAVRWIARYPRARFDVNRGKRERRLLAARAPGRVVVGDDALYVCSRDALAVICVRRADGDIVWSRDLADCRMITGLAPATAAGPARLVVQGEAVECLDASGGTRLWRWKPPRGAGAVFGAGAIGGEFVYVPTGAALHRVSIADGQTTDTTMWRDLALGGPVGNLTVLADSILGFDGRRFVRLGSRKGELTRTEIEGDVVRGVALASALPQDAEFGPPLVALSRLGPSGIAIHLPPDAGEGECYFEFGDGLARVDAGAGRIVWRTRLAESPSRLAWSRSLVVAVYEKHLVALDRARGGVVWTHALTLDAAAHAHGSDDKHGFYEVTSGGRYVAARQKDSSKVHVIDAATGARLRLFEVKGIRCMVIEGDTLVTGVSADRKFAAIGWEPVTGKELWREVVPIEPRGQWSVTTSDRSDMFFCGNGRVARFDVATRRISKAVKCELRQPIASTEAGRVMLTGQMRSVVLDARTGERLFEGTPSGGNRQKRGRPYRYTDGRAIHAWHEGGKFRVECRSVPGAKILWKSEAKSPCYPVDAMAVGGGWLEICARDQGGDSKRERGPAMAYRLYDIESGRLIDERDLPGTPTGLGRPQAALVGKRVFYVAREGIFALGGASGSIEGAVASVRKASTRMSADEREAAAEFITTYEPDVRRAFVPSEPIRVDGRLDDWAGIRAVTIADPLAARSEGGSGWSGPEDLSARARVAWDAERVYVSVDATDDVHAPAAAGADLLTGDSLVVAFEAGAAKGGKRDEGREAVVSFALALARGRPAMRRLRGTRTDSPGVEGEANCEFHAVRRAGGVTYELAVPWPLLRPAPDERPGKAPEMGLAVAVIDRDDARPEAAVEWGTGLVRGVRPDAFGRIKFIDITPRRIAQYREFMALMPSHELSLKFLASIGEAQDGRAEVAVRIAELERFLKLRPARVNSVPALGELARRYRQAGGEDALARAAAFARRRRVDTKAVADVAGPSGGTWDEGRFIRQQVFLDPAAPPKVVSVRFKSREGEWSHGAYWSSDAAVASASVSSKRWPASTLPPKGRWADLVIPVGVVGLDAHEVRSIGFAAAGGRALWGRTEYHHDGKVTVVVDDKLPQGGRFHGEGKPRWVAAPGRGGARAHTRDPGPGTAAYEIECGRASFKTRLAKPKEDDADRDARRRLYLEAAPLIPENAEALELLKDAEELYRGLKSEERREAVARIYEDFLRAAPDTPLAYTVLDRLHSVYGRENRGSMERCEAIMDEAGVGREQRRTFYRGCAPSIRSWKVLGYFDPGAGKQNLEKELRAERFPIALSASYADSGGGKATWRDAESSWHSLDLWDHLPSRQRGYPVAYAYTRVEVPQARKACLVLGIGRGGVVWVNGKRTGPAIWSGFRRDRHYVPVQLKAGLNDILAKIVHSSGRGQISCRIADQNGRPIDGVKASLPVNLVSAVGTVEPESVRVVFSEPVERSSAETVSNYAVSDDVTITGASLGGDRRTVTLWMSPLARGTTYTLTVGGVRSAASALRGVERGSTKEFVVLGSGGGLTGTYFSELEFKGTSFKRIDETVDFAWGEKSPKDVEPGDYSVRWTGFVEPLYSEEYTFITASDDGVRLWVNGRKLVDNWTDHGVVEDSGKVRLEALKRYEIKLEYFQGWGDSCIRLYWSSRSQEREVIPRTQLYPEE